MSTPILRFNNVCFSRGREQVLDHLTLDIFPGSIHALLGPNGAGKSTTMQLACGLLCPDQGSIECFGLDPYQARTQVSAMVGFMPEEPALYNNMYTGELIQFIAQLHGQSGHGEFLDHIVELCHLKPLLGKLVGQLSKGNRQKVALAQTLIAQPKFLILDEPTAGLDPVSVIDVRNLIRTLAQQGKSILISTHILSEAQHLCDSMTVLKHGHIVASGPISSLQSTHLGKVAVRMRFQPDQVSELIDVLSKFNAIVEKQQSAEIIFLLAHEETIPALVAACVQQGVSIFEVVQEQQNIEQLFIQLTRGKHEANNLTH